eukprot:TRINITY_DN48642_c0_g1_i2.p1 TRINITY_DN48642_c0_g1~~TRINITY_DN48642_c0_g1_i2.p1  ORF type:complete len:182 (-),score=5.35 TRINITY_DN48642_c0_g1_i2:49-594(-)
MSNFDDAITVGYWTIRGLGAPLRQMVLFSGRKLNNVMYDLTETDGKFDANCWFSKKVELKEKNALINLPYVIDGDLLITQSNACFSYLGRKLNLWGNNEEEIIRCEELLCELMDIRNNMIKYAYTPNSTTESAEAYLQGAFKLGDRCAPFNQKMAGFGASPDGTKWVNGQKYNFNELCGIF